MKEERERRFYGASAPREGTKANWWVPHARAPSRDNALRLARRSNARDRSLDLITSGMYLSASRYRNRRRIREFHLRRERERAGGREGGRERNISRSPTNVRRGI